MKKNISRVISFILMIIIIISVRQVYGAYTGGTAMWDINISDEGIISLDLSPGSSTVVVPFTITGQAGMYFSMTIKIGEIENLPISYKIYKDELCTEEIEEKTFYEVNTELKSFYLKIEWPESENDEYYATEIEYIPIEVVFMQEE